MEFWFHVRPGISHGKAFGQEVYDLRLDKMERKTVNNETFPQKNLIHYA